MTLGPSQFGTVGLRELPIVAQELGGVGRYPFDLLGRLPLELAREDVLALQRPTGLLDVEWGHAFEPIEVRRVNRHEAYNAGASGHPLGQTRGNREAVGPATGGADHSEPLDAELVRTRGNVGDAVHDLSAAGAVGAAVAGSVVGDHPCTDFGVRALVVMPIEARTGRTMQQEDRGPSTSPHSANVSVRPSVALTVCVSELSATIHRTTGEHERVLGSVTLAPFSDVWWAQEVVSCAYMQFVVRPPSLLSPAPSSAPVPYPRQRTQTDD